MNTKKRSYRRTRRKGTHTAHTAMKLKKRNQEKRDENRLNTKEQRLTVKANGTFEPNIHYTHQI